MTDLPALSYKPTHACDLIKEGPGQTCPAGLTVPRGTVLTRRALRSGAVLVLLCLAVSGLNMWWTAREIQANNRARCSSVVADATIPLPRPVAGNPSREWEAAFEANARERARQLGCKL